MAQLDLAFFEQILSDQLADTRERIGQEKEYLATEPCPDEIDKVVAQTARDTEAYRVDKLDKTRTQTLEALKRIKAGTFGICEECEEPIPLKRLQAIPHAPLCVGCQNNTENTLKDQGHLTETLEEAA